MAEGRRQPARGHAPYKDGAESMWMETRAFALRVARRRKLKAIARQSRKRSRA